jgi:hypothetical protein
VFDSAVLLSFELQNSMEDKSCLGSRPPSCHNRCSACNPCTPVQVTTVPGPGKSAPRVTGEAVVVAGFSRYSNYKPLGWKCDCAGRLYDP